MTLEDHIYKNETEKMLKLGTNSLKRLIMDVIERRNKLDKVKKRASRHMLFRKYHLRPWLGLEEMMIYLPPNKMVSEVL